MVSKSRVSNSMVANKANNNELNVSYLRNQLLTHFNLFIWGSERRGRPQERTRGGDEKGRRGDRRTVAAGWRGEGG